MTIEQSEDFQMRRNALIKKHRQRDPALRQAKRRSLIYLLMLPLYAAIAMGVMLLGMKSVSIALNTPSGYLAMVDPVLANTPSGSLRATLIAPDPVSTEIAAVLRPLLRPSTAASADGREAAVPLVDGARPRLQLAE